MSYISTSNNLDIYNFHIHFLHRFSHQKVVLEELVHIPSLYNSRTRSVQYLFAIAIPSQPMFHPLSIFIIYSNTFFVPLFIFSCFSLFSFHISPRKRLPIVIHLHQFDLLFYIIEPFNGKTFLQVESQQNCVLSSS